MSAPRGHRSPAPDVGTDDLRFGVTRWRAPFRVTGGLNGLTSLGGPPRTSDPVDRPLVGANR